MSKLIRVKFKTWKFLNKLKKYPRETYDDVIIGLVEHKESKAI